MCHFRCSFFGFKVKKVLKLGKRIVQEWNIKEKYMELKLIPKLWDIKQKKPKNCVTRDNKRSDKRIKKFLKLKKINYLLTF